MSSEEGSGDLELFNLAEKEPQKGSIEIQKYINKLENVKQKDWDALSDAYCALGIAYKKLEDWTKGLENEKNAINIAKKIKKNFTKIIKTCKARKEIGSINEIIEEYPKAIKELDESLKDLEKILDELMKDQKKLPEDEFLRKSSIVKSMFFDFLKQKVSIYLKLKNEKKAKESIFKPWIKFLDKKSKHYIEDLANFAELYTFIAKTLEQPIELLNWTGELIILDVFAKKISTDRAYWTKKVHQHIKENSQILIDLLNISIGGEILGKETLNMLKEIELEDKDFMYIDKLLDSRKKKHYLKNIETLNTLFQEASNDNAALAIQIMILNELVLALGLNYEYKTSIQKSKDAIKLLKSFKHKDLKNFFSGKFELTKFRVNLKKQDYKQAEKEAKKAIDYFEQSVATIGHSNFAKLELASCYMIQDQLDKAESILEDALEDVEEIKSLEFIARLYDLLGGLKLKSEDNYSAALNFQISALFYLYLNDIEKYKEFVTLAINLYREYLETLDITGIELK
ncbi:MAG: hypothetical protein HWN67_03930 [Candidatus Helarchaeota archaeon]|nr:hypothetical protein [Candidatus Helarchaeota archaeon]